MGEIRDKDVIKTRPITVSPLFTLPYDLDEGSVRRADLVEYEGTDIDADYDDNGGDPNGPDKETGANNDPHNQPWGPDRLTPPPIQSPLIVGIKSQTIRQAEDGTTVVDVVFEFDDIAGATGYEVRLAQ